MSEERLRSRGVNLHAAQPGSLVHHQLVFNKLSSAEPKEGFANVFECRGALVEGVLYDIDAKDFDILDRYEGYPTHYRRTLRNVVASNNSAVRAYIYIANPQWVRDDLRPSRGYLTHLLGGKPFLSDAYYQRLVATITSD